MKKLLCVTILFSGMSLAAQISSSARDPRPVLTEDGLTSASATVASSESPATAVKVRPIISPVVGPIVVAPVPTDGPIIVYPSNPIVYPSSPLSPP